MFDKLEISQMPEYIPAEQKLSPRNMFAPNDEQK